MDIEKKRVNNLLNQKKSSTSGLLISILRYCGYFGTLILSFFQGEFTRFAVLPVYPYSKPRAIGWLGPGSFFAMYGVIGGIALRKNPKNPIQERHNWEYIGFTIAGLIIFTLSLIVGIKNTEIFSVGVDYGVYSNQKYIK